MAMPHWVRRCQGQARSVPLYLGMGRQAPPQPIKDVRASAGWLARARLCQCHGPLLAIASASLAPKNAALMPQLVGE
eukprot:12301226-Alexandrium_andersonii.AAC.1